MKDFDLNEICSIHFRILKKVISTKKNCFSVFHVTPKTTYNNNMNNFYLFISVCNYLLHCHVQITSLEDVIKFRLKS